ncbi:hypothetical protein pipiens_006328 [Culex pipiens pipiens]|uniref:Post-SET domain-containing protein n=1 Tax=Culex pipiens pipiens TaxID=38569 RepID=A0ABD1DR23_CULPP
MPLCDEIVWAKYSVFKFWPAIAIPPPTVLDVVFRRQHEQTDICLRFRQNKLTPRNRSRTILALNCRYKYEEEEGPKATWPGSSTTRASPTVRRCCGRSAEANPSGCLPSRTSRWAFNYNVETFGDQKKICYCGAGKCSGLIVSQTTMLTTSYIDMLLDMNSLARVIQFISERGYLAHLIDRLLKVT